MWIAKVKKSRNPIIELSVAAYQMTRFAQHSLLDREMILIWSLDLATRLFRDSKPSQNLLS